MTDTLRFEISGDLFETFPELEVWVLRARLPDQADLSGAVSALKTPLEAAAAALTDVEPITALEEIARWRRAYGKLGVKPSKYPSSLEALLRRAKKGQAAEVGIPAVDLYNAVSVIRRVPLGAYDVARLGPEPMVLRRADPAADGFDPLGAAPGAFPLNPDLVVHAQGANVLCWGFNTRDSASTAVDAGSQDILFVSELTESAGRPQAQAAMSDLAAAFTAAGGLVSAPVGFSADMPAGPVSGI